MAISSYEDETEPSPTSLIFAIVHTLLAKQVLKGYLFVFVCVCFSIKPTVCSPTILYSSCPTHLLVSVQAVEKTDTCGIG